MLIRFVALLLGLAIAAPAAPQGIPNFLPANTVVGRLASNPGPTSAIPFATLAAQLGVGSTYLAASSVAGTNSITSITTAAPALASGQTVLFIPANTNTAATTFNRDATGAINVFYNGAALGGGELVAGVPAILYYDGTQYNILSNGLAPGNAQQQGSVVAASTVNLDTSRSLYQQITGTTTITSITLANGHVRFVEFSGALTLTNGASLILQGGANITTAAGATAIFIGEASGVVRQIYYSVPPVASGGTGATTGRGAATNLAVPFILAKSGTAVSAPADTNEDTLATITVPANAMGANGAIRIHAHFTQTNNGNNKTYKFRFSGGSGTAMMATTQAAIDWIEMDVFIMNQNATGSQRSSGSGTQSTPGVANITMNTTASVDTTLQTTIVITAQKASGGDTVTLQHYTVELLSDGN